MARGGRNSTVEEDRMKKMEQEDQLKGGRSGSGPRNFEKPGFHGQMHKTPKSAPRPS